MVKQEEFRFHADAAYLLVGCLGGLGRSLTMWMLEHGCRNFVFLSRSGDDEKAVADVVSTVSSTTRIRGVFHAAMVLRVRRKHSQAEVSILTSSRMVFSRE